MQYKITHTTAYQYSTAVSVCHNLVMLTPREDSRVRIHHHRLATQPLPQFTSRRKDAFGNIVNAFSIEENHRQLTVTASNRVTVAKQELPPADASPSWQVIRDGVAEQSDSNWIDCSRFLFDSPRITRNSDFVDYAGRSYEQERPALEALRDLTSRIHRDFKYDKSATMVSTATSEAFRLRRGVCQDFAHIGIACLRSIGLPARYVSGYLRTYPPAGKPRLVGADQSHAWVAAYCGPKVGWVEVDPTNNCLCGTDHVPVAWGRDYGDVVPLRGVFLGGGAHQLKVSVDVQPTDAETAAAPGPA
jgi:transglutaminase-like putative cysteine protease